MWLLVYAVISINPWKWTSYCTLHIVISGLYRPNITCLRIHMDEWNLTNFCVVFAACHEWIIHLSCNQDCGDTQIITFLDLDLNSHGTIVLLDLSLRNIDLGGDSTLKRHPVLQLWENVTKTQQSNFNAICTLRGDGHTCTSLRNPKFILARWLPMIWFCYSIMI